MIRQAREEDIRAIAELSKAYHEEHWWGEHTDFDKDHAHQTIVSYYVSGAVNIMVYECPEHGVMAFSMALLIPMYWTKQLRCANAYNYIDPDHRNKGIFEDFVAAQEQWARSKGCVDIHMGDGGQYRGKYTTVTAPLGYERSGTDAYKVLNNE